MTNESARAARDAGLAGMEKLRPEILVSGATGLQGGAVARRLLQDGWPVRFLTRDPDSAKARALVARGARAIAGDLEDIEAARLACRGVYGVFSIQNFWEHGYEREIHQGGNLVDAARHEGVQHFVYASVGGVGRTDGLGITHFDTKGFIEQRLMRNRRAPAQVANLDRARLIARCGRETQDISGKRQVGAWSAGDARYVLSAFTGPNEDVVKSG